jgi:putative Holliday junction resolvase
MRQIGVAVGNRVTGTSQPLTTLRARDGIPDWTVIAGLLEEWQPTQLLVGEPLNMDGSESELSRLAAKFGRRLEGRFQLPVAFMDERLSSFEAKEMLREQGHKGDYREQPADSLAAHLILQSWLQQQDSPG